MKKDFSKFKVLGITLLVTMSSCVAGSLELNAETLRAYGFEFDISSAEKIHSVQKSKKSRISPNSKFRFVNIIDFGREYIPLRNLSFNYSFITFQFKFNHFQSPLINKTILFCDLIQTCAFKGLNQLDRAGPC